jgi:hypothetical protein
MAFTSTSKLISTLLLLVSFTSKAEGQKKCSLCPDGSSIEDATRDFLGFGACGDSEDLLSKFLPGAQCDEFMVIFNAMYDQPAFCCSNMYPQGICSLCEDGSSLTNPDLPIYNGTTCSDIFTASAYIVNATICESFTAARPICCSGQSACQLCPNGGEIEFPDRAVPFLEEWGATTCGDLDAVLSTVSEAECGNTLALLESDVSYPALCGCTDVTTPAICDFCGKGDLVDPDQVILESDGGTTCQQFDELAPYVTSMETCANILGGRHVCCTNPDPTCAICPNGSPVGLPDRKIFFLDVDLTCAELDQRVSFFPEDECTVQLGSSDVNFASWCGCAGVDTSL